MVTAHSRHSVSGRHVGEAGVVLRTEGPALSRVAACWYHSVNSHRAFLPTGCIIHHPPRSDGAHGTSELSGSQAGFEDVPYV